MKESGNSMSTGIDEEALADHHGSAARKVLGAFFTPAALARDVVALAAPHVPSGAKLRVIDPACGAGSLLVAARERWPGAELVGVEIDAVAAGRCAERLPGATIRVGNALIDDVLPEGTDTFELWLGNPPWNGTSSLLKEPAVWDRVRKWLPPAFELKRRTSLREDFVFFLLLAARRLKSRRGAIAFITSASLLDAFAHEPVRRFLLSSFTLRERRVLSRGTFEGTRVEPAVTVWTTERSGTAIDGDALSLREVGDEARALDTEWRKTGVPLSDLVPVSFAGLKTRFDELLVDADRVALETRLRALLEGGSIESFAERFGLERFLPKLRALDRSMPFDPANVRPFVRYRGPLPMKPTAWCYVSRELIPRGDHRLRGAFDPHRDPLKLVFNRLELPLAAHVIEQPGCITMYRHSRFAPSMVPAELLDDPEARPDRVSRLVPNVRRNERLDVREVFERVARHVMSAPFQKVWAPAFGTTREIVVPWG